MLNLFSVLGLSFRVVTLEFRVDTKLVHTMPGKLLGIKIYRKKQLCYLLKKIQYYLSPEKVLSQKFLSYMRCTCLHL